MDKTSAPIQPQQPMMSRDAGVPVYGVSGDNYGVAAGDSSPAAIPGVAAIGAVGALGSAGAQSRLRGLLQGLAAGGAGYAAGTAAMPKDGEPDWRTGLAVLGGGGLGWLGSDVLLDALGVKKDQEKKKNEKYGSVLEEKDAAANPALTQLLMAKAYSDRKHYLRKHSILRDLISKKPDDFFVDSEADDGIVGLTHSPTNFRIHMPGKMMPTDVTVARRLPEPVAKAASRVVALLGGSQ